MNLPRDEMAFRVEYEEMLKEQSLTTVFRPGNRIYPNWRGYQHGEIITGRIIERCGSDLDEIPPIFKASRIPLRIARIETITVANINQQDFLGSSKDVSDLQSLEQHIQKIYNKSLAEYDNVITRIELEYLDVGETQLRA